MDTIAALYHRRAIRDYTEMPVATEQINFLIAAAAQAPNAMDRQHWAFVVIRDRNLLERLSAQAKAHLLATMDPHSDIAALREHVASPQFNIFYNAPALIVICATDNDAFTQQDCCLAAANLMIAAQASGLGTCWIGFAEAWLNQAEAKKELGIPAYYRPVAPIILGHPRVIPTPPPRHRPDVTWIEP